MNNINNKEYSDFLKKLDLEKIKKYFVRIIVLTSDELPIQSIEGRISSGSINIDGSSSMRRTCNLTFLASEDNNDLRNIDNLLSINKKIKIEIGLENNIDNRYDDIIWFKQGIFIINQPSINHSLNGTTISLSCKDKMCLLNGECGGSLPASVIFDSYNQINPDGSITEERNLVYHIIETLVINYGYELPHKIFVNDVPLEIKQAVRWTGMEPLFYNKNTDMYSINSEIVKSENETDKNNVWSTFNYNDDIGYAFVDFTYPGELVSGIGENVCSVLDKIKNLLGNYEYFYDIDGNFVFQEIKNYLNNSYTKTAYYNEDNEILDNNIAMLDNSNYYVDYNADQKIIYDFTEGNGLISSYSNSILYTSIKNDFHVWGKNNDKNVIHYHVAIKEKPAIFPHKVVFIKDIDGNLTGKIRLPKEEEDEIIIDYLPTDWRAELYIQGLEDQKNGKRPDIYKQELLDLFDDIYDFSAFDDETKQYGKFKADMINNPNNLRYFIDFLEPANELSDYSIDSLGTKIYSYKQDNVNKIFEATVPDIIILNINEDYDKRQHYIDKCELIGQSFSNVDNNIYSKIAMNTSGYSAANTARELLYQYTDYNSSISIQSIPIYYLDVNRRITVNDKASNIHGDYIIKSISLPLDAKSTMSISATKALERI